MSLRVYLLCGLLILLAGSLSVTAQHERVPGGIERLQATPVAQIEAELPDTRFDRWFAGLVQPAKPEYEINDCGERNGTPEERGKEFPTCATVTATVGLRKIELSFVVGTYVVPKNDADATVKKPAKIGFFSGSIGPADPSMKFPTLVIRKLSEVEKLLRP